MIHYTCDMCGKTLPMNDNVRYIVKIEVYAAYDPLEITEEDLNQDHSNEIAQLCEKMAKMDPQELEDEVYKCFRFDLCSSCQKEYLKDPLFQKTSKHLRFLQN